MVYAELIALLTIGVPVEDKSQADLMALLQACRGWTN
jgi:hypothetical protein